MRNYHPRRHGVTLLLALHLACASTSPQKLPTRGETAARKPEERAGNKAQTASPLRASMLFGKKEAASAPRPKMIACERERLRVFIYDGGPEYYYDRMSGDLLYVQDLPQEVVPDDPGVQPRGGGVGETQAVEIAKKHFADLLASYGDDREHVKAYDAVPCEMSKAWRIFFDYRMLPGQTLATMPNTNPPDYVVDKRTGKITYTTHKIDR